MPKAWRRAKVIALAKPGKDLQLLSCYQPILCSVCLIKLLARVVLRRISHHAGRWATIHEQSRFQTGP